MALEATIQKFVHAIEEGGWVRPIRFVVVIACAIGIATFLLVSRYKGLTSGAGMDQAQIAREIARGNGFSTKFIRPVALAQFRANRNEFPAGNIPDTLHAPLGPFVNSLVLRLASGTWDMPMTQLIYPSDRIISALSMLFFLLAVAVFYVTAKRLFDERVAGISSLMVLVSRNFWDFGLTGLPQLLMVFLFSVALYLCVRAVVAQQSGGKPIFWLAAAGLMFGLLALTHPLTVWIFVGFLAFALIYFRPFPRDAVIMVAVFVVVVSPWLLRNYKVCGSPFGIGLHSLKFEMMGEESNVFRQADASLAGLSLNAMKGKVQNQLEYQFSSIYALLGFVVTAPIFFVSLFHLFRKREVAVFRWAILLMWISAVMGMAVIGLQRAPNDPDDLHLLFIPIMAAYGLAFLLVLWNRIAIPLRVARLAFAVTLIVLTGLPFARTLIGKTGVVNWPPYVPPYIAIMNDWIGEGEVIASDMPWAVAWYADRVSIWPPIEVRELIDWNDYNVLRRPVVALYLTPVTGNLGFIREIAKGEWKEWAPFIMRNANLQNFPLKAVTGLPIDNECVLYADKDRWSAAKP